MAHNKINFNLFLHEIRTSKLWLLLVFFFAASFTVSAQNIYNLNIEKVPGEGLLNKRITCINQDMNGFIWFGTVEGLFIYDGYGYKAFRNMPGWRQIMDWYKRRFKFYSYQYTADKKYIQPGKFYSERCFK